MIPAWLTVQEFDIPAWVRLVPFRMAEVHHSPWPLQPAEVEFRSNGTLEANPPLTSHSRFDPGALRITRPTPDPVLPQRSHRTQSQRCCVATSVSERRSYDHSTHEPHETDPLKRCSLHRGCAPTHTPRRFAPPLSRGNFYSFEQPKSPLERGARRAGCVDSRDKPAARTHSGEFSNRLVSEWIFLVALCVPACDSPPPGRGRQGLN